MKICRITNYVDSDTGRTIHLVEDAALNLPIQAVGTDTVTVSYETPLGPSSRDLQINFEIDPVTPKLAALFERFEACRDAWLEANLPDAVVPSKEAHDGRQ